MGLRPRWRAANLSRSHGELSQTPNRRAAAAASAGSASQRGREVSDLCHTSATAWQTKLLDSVGAYAFACDHRFIPANRARALSRSAVISGRLGARSGVAALDRACTSKFSGSKMTWKPWMGRDHQSFQQVARRMQRHRRILISFQLHYTLTLRTFAAAPRSGARGNELSGWSSMMPYPPRVSRRRASRAAGTGCWICCRPSPPRPSGAARRSPAPARSLARSLARLIAPDPERLHLHRDAGLLKVRVDTV